MTAPDVNADVRARFEAWHDAKWPEPKSGEPYHWRVARADAKNKRWEVWQAAHADLSGDVRELVEALKLCASVCAGETMSKSGLVRALEAAQAALAKFGQEKP